MGVSRECEGILESWREVVGVVCRRRGLVVVVEEIMEIGNGKGKVCVCVCGCTKSE